MQFGKRKADAPAIVEGSGDYLRNFKDGEVTVRFIEETDDWITFREHYTKDRKSFPCTENSECPGCNDSDEDVRKASRKYATNIMLVKNEMVLPFRIPVSLAKRLFARSERNGGTITNRDYVVMKTGKGLDTEYDVEQEDKYTVDLDSLKAQAKDVQEILRITYEENAPVAEKITMERPKPKDEAEEPLPSKPEAQSDSAETSGDDIEIDEDTLYEMELTDLIDLAGKAGVEVPTDAKKSAVIRALIEASE
jgi:hypothetical protein